MSWTVKHQTKEFAIHDYLTQIQKRQNSYFYIFFAKMCRYFCEMWWKKGFLTKFSLNSTYFFLLSPKPLLLESIFKKKLSKIGAHLRISITISGHLICSNQTTCGQLGNLLKKVRANKRLFGQFYRMVLYPHFWRWIKKGFITLLQKYLSWCFFFKIWNF